MAVSGGGTPPILPIAVAQQSITSNAWAREEVFSC